MLNKKDRIDYFKKLMSLSFDVYHWVYDPDMQRLESNCKNVHIFEEILNSADVKEDLIEQGQQMDFPLVLSISMGLVWCAVYEKEMGEVRKIHLIGPVFLRDISVHTIEENLRNKNVRLTFKRNFVEVLNALPVINVTNLYQYVVMCHYAVNEVEIRRSDIRFRKHGTNLTSGEDLSEESAAVDRRRTWMVEKNLLDNIRQGNLDYKKALHEASAVSSGIRMKLGDPVKHARYSVMVFIALCTRAAIEGGMSPEMAYNIGDEYSQSADLATDVAELGALNHEMYDDFVHRIHELRSSGYESKAIQRAVEFIESNITEEISIEEISEHVGYSKYYLSRKFSKEIGQTINHYIMKLRIDKAKNMLIATDISILDISESLFFCNRSYFSEQFKKLTGLSPGEFREENMIK